jgi:predicted DNA-binding ribbon-helix-helix protein
MQQNKQILVGVNEQMVEDLKKTIQLQGHHLTGALEDSLQAVINDIENGCELSASALDYIQTLETGISADKINIAASLDAMTKYVQLRMGYQGSKAVNVAYLILSKQREEGNPTENSKQFSQTGERTKVVTNTFLANQDKYGEMIDVAVAGVLDRELNQITSQTF